MTLFRDQRKRLMQKEVTPTSFKEEKRPECQRRGIPSADSCVCCQALGVPLDRQVRISLTTTSELAQNSQKQQEGMGDFFS